MKVIFTTDHEGKAAPAQMAAYGIEEYEVYNFHYPRLRLPEIELIKKLLEDITSFEPDTVFTEFPYDVQVDHEVTARAATDAMRMLRWFIYGVYYYKATSRSFRPNMYLDISDVFLKKVDY